MILAIPFAAFGDPVAKAHGGGSMIDWQLSVIGHDRVELRVMTPSGDLITREFKGGQSPSLRLQDLGTELEDGTYQYELRIYQKVSPAVAKSLEKARAANDDAAAKRIMKDAGLTSQGHTGAFTIQNGVLVNPEAVEHTPSDAVSSIKDGSARENAGSARPGKVGVNDQVIPDDLIVQGSACVGLDCVNNENFGFDTIRLKENNLRIHFDDTSTSAGFPANDWRIIANDSASGGSSKFSVEDSTSAKTPMTITAGAATNSIFVDSTGRVGFRTSTPVLDLHVSTGNTPAIRLEQTTSAGFTAQTWDVAGNEANFFVRDVTGGSRLPFRIRPGAPTSSIDISADGDVGVGTASPDELLHVFANENLNTLLQIENPNTGTEANATFRAKADVGITDLKVHGSGRTLVRFGKTLGSWSEFLNSAGNGLIVGTLGANNLVLGTNSVNRMEINGSTGAVTVSGNFTVTGVKSFAMVDPENDKKAIYYAALEGPEAGTYYRGTAKTSGGSVTIELPGFFSRITEQERMTVQITPVGAPGQAYVAEKTPEHLVIKVADGAADLEFDYFVQGVRKGYLDFKVERDNDLPKQ
jgi:hypothetical protein